MRSKTKLKNCLDELAMINQAYSALSVGNKTDRDERKSKVAALLARKSALKKKLMPLIDEYVLTIDKERR